LIALVSFRKVRGLIVVFTVLEVSYCALGNCGLAGETSWTLRFRKIEMLWHLRQSVSVKNHRLSRGGRFGHGFCRHVLLRVRSGRKQSFSPHKPD
jgi:hypothetical protein